MARSCWVGLGLALLVTGLLALGAPAVAAAAPDGAAGYAYQPGSDGLDPNDRNLISLPGVFTMRLGQTSSTSDGALKFDGTQVELPGINATATIDGFTFSLRDGSYGWDAITVTQMGPRENDAVTLSNTQVSIQGPATNFSTDASARVEVHPSPEVQAGATIGFSYDGLTSQAGLAVADGTAQVTAGPATITVEGLNTGDGAFSVDAAQVMFPEAETGVRVDGFTVADGNASWEALAWYGREFNLGNAVTLSDNLVVVPGPNAANPASGGATTTFEVNAGDVAQTSGQLVLTSDPATGQPALALRNGSAVLGVAGWNMAVSGINTGPNGATVDTVQMSLAPLNLQAQVTGVAVSEGSGVTFDQARVRYLPDPAAGATTIAGFELVIDSTEAGYIVTTTTLVPTATASSQP